MKNILLITYASAKCIPVLVETRILQMQHHPEGLEQYDEYLLTDLKDAHKLEFYTNPTIKIMSTTFLQSGSRMLEYARRYAESKDYPWIQYNACDVIIPKTITRFPPSGFCQTPMAQIDDDYNPYMTPLHFSSSSWWLMNKAIYTACPWYGGFIGHGWNDFDQLHNVINRNGFHHSDSDLRILHRKHPIHRWLMCDESKEELEFNMTINKEIYEERKSR